MADHPHLGTVGTWAAAREMTPEIGALGTLTGGLRVLKPFLARVEAVFAFGVVAVKRMPAGVAATLAARRELIPDKGIRGLAYNALTRASHAPIASGRTSRRVVRACGGYAATPDERTSHVYRHRASVNMHFESVAASSRGCAAGTSAMGRGYDLIGGLGEYAALGVETVAQFLDSCFALECRRVPLTAVTRRRFARRPRTEFGARSAAPECRQLKE
jgi:chemotaxis response regulator CheB